MTSSQTTAARAAPEGRPATLPGRPFPLGATPGELLGRAGTNFALASSVAGSVTLCLFDQAGTETQIPLLESDADIWYGFVPGTGPGKPTGTASTARGTRRGACGAIRPSCCSTRTRRRWPGRSPSARKCSARTPPTPASRAPWIRRRTCPAA